jgi:hypothetical protein
VRPQTGFNTLPLAARLSIVLFGTVGLASAMYMLSQQQAFDSSRVLFLLVTAGVTARARVNMFKNTTLSFLTCVVLFTVLTEGPGIAVLVGIAGVGAQSLLPSKKIILHQLVFNVGMIALTVTASWWTHRVFAANDTTTVLSTQLIATVLASFIYFVGNSLSVSLIIALTKRVSMIDIWANHFLHSAPTFLIAGLLSLGLVALTGSAGFVLFLFIGAMSIAYYGSIRLMTQSAAAK